MRAGGGRPSPDSEVHGLREVMLGCVVNRPRTAARLFDLVREQWGECCAF